MTLACDPLDDDWGAIGERKAACQCVVEVRRTFIHVSMDDSEKVAPLKRRRPASCPSARSQCGLPLQVLADLDAKQEVFRCCPPPSCTADEGSEAGSSQSTCLQGEDGSGEHKIGEHDNARHDGAEHDSGKHDRAHDGGAMSSDNDLSVCHAAYPNSQESAASEADGLDNLLTVMLRNLPCRLSREELVQAVTELGFGHLFVFLYMPTKHGHLHNSGFAFVGFDDPAVTRRFSEVMSGFRFASRRSEKSVVVAPARLQNLEQLHAHFSGSRFGGTRVPPIFAAPGIGQEQQTISL